MKVTLTEALPSKSSQRSTSARVKVIELRFFGGLTVEEAAAVLQVSPDTVMRDWKLAKAWLLREMRGDR